jgi:hypothetical protein
MPWSGIYRGPASRGAYDTIIFDFPTYLVWAVQLIRVSILSSYTA